MVIHVDAVLGVILTVLSIALVGGAVIAVLRSGYLRQTNKDLIERVSVLEAEQVRDKATIIAHEAKIDALESIVTGRDLLSAIIASLSEIKGILTNRPRP